MCCLVEESDTTGIEKGEGRMTADPSEGRTSGRTTDYWGTWSSYWDIGAGSWRAEAAVEEGTAS